mmetsp:Transcript_20188/g.50861  ORF Transcript_20188/g.50861 Transcript_20188/m.50861 type:complete len:214 (-) Transcript_20188:225-866(-)
MAAVTPAAVTSSLWCRYSFSRLPMCARVLASTASADGPVCLWRRPVKTLRLHPKCSSCNCKKPPRTVPRARLPVAARNMALHPAMLSTSRLAGRLAIPPAVMAATSASPTTRRRGRRAIWPSAASVSWMQWFSSSQVRLAADSRHASPSSETCMQRDRSRRCRRDSPAPRDARPCPRRAAPAVSIPKLHDKSRSRRPVRRLSAAKPVSERPRL